MNLFTLWSLHSIKPPEEVEGNDCVYVDDYCCHQKGHSQLWGEGKEARQRKDGEGKMGGKRERGRRKGAGRERRNGERHQMPYMHTPTHQPLKPHPQPHPHHLLAIVNHGSQHSPEQLKVGGKVHQVYGEIEGVPSEANKAEGAVDHVVLTHLNGMWGI